MRFKGQNAISGTRFDLEINGRLGDFTGILGDVVLFPKDNDDYKALAKMRQALNYSQDLPKTRALLEDNLVFQLPVKNDSKIKRKGPGFPML